MVATAYDYNRPRHRCPRCGYTYTDGSYYGDTAGSGSATYTSAGSGDEGAFILYCAPEPEPEDFFLPPRVPWPRSPRDLFRPAMQFWPLKEINLPVRFRPVKQP